MDRSTVALSGNDFGAEADGFHDEALSARERPLSDLEGEVQRQKTALLFRNAGIAATVHVINASLLAYVNASSHTAPHAALLWWSIVVIISLGRYWMTQRFMAAGQHARDATPWQLRYVCATALTAAAWGAGAVLFMWQAPDGAMLFTGLVLAGMAAGAVPILAPVPAAFGVFALTLVVPVIPVVLLQATSPLHVAFGSVTAVFLATILMSARYLHETLDVSIRLGLEQRHLADHLKRARDAAESALTQHRRTEAVLQASEERYRLILQYLPTGILHYDKDLVVTYCNDRLAQIIAVPTDVLVGIDMKDLDDRRILPALRAALEGKEGSYEGEYLSTRSGVQVMVSMSCTPLRVSIPTESGHPFRSKPDTHPTSKRTAFRAESGH